MRSIKWKSGYKQLRWHVCVPALSSACMNFSGEAAIIRCMQADDLKNLFFLFFFPPPTEETFARSLWSKISVANHKNLFLFMSVWYKQEHDKMPPPNTSILKKRVFVWCSVLWVWDRSSVGGPVCLFSASTSLWCCEAADQGRYLHIFLSQLKTRCLFLLSGVGGSCGSVPHYSSVKCCLWILDGHWVLTDKVRKELSESCHSAIQVSEGCCYIPPKPPLLQPGQVCFPQSFLTGHMLQPLGLSCWSSAEHVPVVCKFIIFWKPGEDLHNTECSPVCS